MMKNKRPAFKKSKKIDFLDEDFNIDTLTEITEVISPKKKKKISRAKPGQKPINYFTIETQQSIIDFQQASTVKEKNQIYLTKIYPALDSLVENLINVYGFTVAHETRLDLKNECLEFLFTTLPKFNAEKGSKAFSYFNVVAKNWLTIKSKQNVKRVQSYISLDDTESITQHDLQTIENHNIVPPGDEIIDLVENSDYLLKLVSTISGTIKTENEKRCVDAIKVLVNDLENLDLLNKRAILVYLRELTGFSSKQLSIVLASLKKHYRDAKYKVKFQAYEE